MTTLIILIFLIPFGFILNMLIKQASLASNVIKEVAVTGNIFGVDCNNSDSVSCKLSESIKGISANPNIKFYLEDFFRKTTSSLTQSISKFIFAIPRRILDIFIIFFVSFYLFRDGELILEKIKGLIPMKKDHKEHIIKRFEDITYAVLYGTIIASIVQGVLGTLGFFILGLLLLKFGGIYSSILLGSPILWGIMMALFALIPFLGAVVVWLPIALIELLSGIIKGNAWQTGIGIALMVYGIFFISIVDNIIKPKIVGEKAGIHPMLIFLGVIGGLALFGLIGAFIGPIILTILIAFLKIYKEEII